MRTARSSEHRQELALADQFRVKRPDLRRGIYSRDSFPSEGW